MNEQGEVPSLPTVAIGWDHVGQKVQIQFDPHEFKTWGFLKSVLKMAMDQCDEYQELAKDAAKKQQVLQQGAAIANAHAIRRGLAP